jgi:hypothetical protein
MDRADEIIYAAGLLGVPRMTLWVKSSPWGGKLGVWGICSPPCAKISRRNLQYPGACSGDSLFNMVKILGFFCRNFVGF